MFMTYRKKGAKCDDDADKEANDLSIQEEDDGDVEPERRIETNDNCNSIEEVSSAEAIPALGARAK